MDGLTKKKRGRPLKINEAVQQQIIDLWRDRHKTTAIARKLNLSYTTVYYALRRFYLVG